VTAGVDENTEAIFDLHQIGIELAEQTAKQCLIIKGEISAGAARCGNAAGIG
jgi:hypothetical protein